MSPPIVQPPLVLPHEPFGTEYSERESLYARYKLRLQWICTCPLRQVAISHARDHIELDLQERHRVRMGTFETAFGVSAAHAQL